MDAWSAWILCFTCLKILIQCVSFDFFFYRVLGSFGIFICSQKMWFFFFIHYYYMGLKPDGIPSVSKSDVILYKNWTGQIKVAKLLAVKLLSISSRYFLCTCVVPHITSVQMQSFKWHFHWTHPAPSPHLLRVVYNLQHLKNGTLGLGGLTCSVSRNLNTAQIQEVEIHQLWRLRRICAACCLHLESTCPRGCFGLDFTKMAEVSTNWHSTGEISLQRVRANTSSVLG